MVKAGAATIEGRETLPIFGAQSTKKSGCVVKILVVEDDPLIGPAMKAVLTSVAHEVVGPVRAAAKASRLAARMRPDLALVDYHLAGGEDGLSLVRRLRRDLGVPSLLVTGFDHRFQEVRDDALGLLRKPFTPQALTDAVAAVERLLHGLLPPVLPPSLVLFGEPRPAA
nr:response regulator [Azospirillum oleiclasticum]